MKSTNNLNINTRSYWNSIYGTVESRNIYRIAGTDKDSMDSHIDDKNTHRFQQAFQNVNPKDKVLDIGCGVGVFTKMVKRELPDCEVWGTDISDKVIESNKIEEPSNIYSQGYIGELKHIPDNYFDVIFCGETIEHLDDPSILFDEAYQKLKKRGKLIITTPKEDHIKSEEHLWLFTPEDVENLYLKSGFKKVKFEQLHDMEHLFVIFAVGTK